MDFAALLEPAVKFFSEGVGKVIANFVWMLYEILYPANALPARPIEIPK